MIAKGDVVRYSGDGKEYKVLRVFKHSDLIVLGNPKGKEEAVYTWAWKCGRRST